MKFHAPEVALFLYKCDIRPCMEYCFHVWAGSAGCYMKLLDKPFHGYTNKNGDW